MKQRNSIHFGGQVALGGILIGLSVVCLYIAAIVPGIELTLLLASSLLAAVMMIESKGKGGWLLYGSVLILGLVLTPNKLIMIPYGLFFGLYPIVKSLAERKVQGKGQILVKIIFFTVVMLAVYSLASEVLFGGTLLENAPIAVLIVVGEVFFLVFDWVLSVLISYYYRRFHGVI